MSKLKINIERACRSCLDDQNTNMLSLQDFMEITILPKSNFTIAEILMEFTSINIMSDDELPQSICSVCVKKVQDAFIYKKMCEISDEKLRLYVSKEANSAYKTTPQSSDNHTEAVIIPEVVHVTDDFYARDDLFDENLVDDLFDGFATQSDGETEAEPEPEPVSEPEIKSKTDQKGEDFRIVNNAKQINGRYMCEICQKTLADRRTFLLHTRLHLGKNLKHCDICGRGFAKKNHLDRHRATHSAHFSCKNCSKTFRSKALRRKHSCAELNIENVDEPTLKIAKKCEIENTADAMDNYSKIEVQITDNESSLHSIAVHSEESIKKDVISRNKIEASTTEKSQNIAFDEEEQRLLNGAITVNSRLQCPICPRTLSQRKILRLHLRSHLGKNLKHCEVCGRGFAKGSNLNRHKLLHCQVDNDQENEIIENATQLNGQLQCPFCAKILIDRQTFRLHIRMHISKGLIRCDICNRGFDNDNELENHLSSHGNQFSCNKCAQIFGTYRERKDHLIAVHGKVDKNPLKMNEIVEKCDDNTKMMTVNCVDNEDKHLVNESNCINGRYECPVNDCKKTLANRTTLKYHIRLHLGKNLLTCDICNQGFSKKSHLKRHLITHTRKNRQPCRHCEAVFETYQERKIHTAAVHKIAAQNHINKTIILSWTQQNGQKQCICMICGHSTDRISKLKNHLDWHANNRHSFEGIDFCVQEELFAKFNIDSGNQNIGTILYNRLKENPDDFSNMYCITNEHGWELSLSDSETETECDDNEIGRSHHSKYKCSKCQQNFDRLHKLMCHMKIDHGGVKEFQEFKCIHCLQFFPNATVLAKHLRQQCENNNKNVVCFMCNNRFIWRNSYNKHVAIYHNTESKFINDNQMNIRPFSCDQCIKSFYRAEHLEAHKASHLPREKKFSCDICKKSFSRTDNLKSHMRVHIPVGEREIVNKHLCSYCGRSFSNSSNLTVHIRRHTGERPYCCEFCNARFPRSSDLQCHRRIHTGEKTCVCTVCGKGFTRSNKLVRHMRIHTGERPYKCTQCDRAFTQSNDLTLHVRRHTGDKPFGCNCGERFITNSLLQMHRRTTGHINDSMNLSISLPTNSVNNPHRMFNVNDGKRTGITAALSTFLSGDIEGGS